MEENRIKRKIKDARKAKSYEGGSSKVGWTFKTSLDSKRGSLINYVLCFPRLVMIGCLTLCPKR